MARTRAVDKYSVCFTDLLRRDERVARVPVIEEAWRVTSAILESGRNRGWLRALAIVW